MGWVIDWVRKNPRYGVAICNCQHFSHDFYEFLNSTGEPLAMNSDLQNACKVLGLRFVSMTSAVGVEAFRTEAAQATASCAAKHGMGAAVLSKAGLCTASSA